MSNMHDPSLQVDAQPQFSAHSTELRVSGRPPDLFAVGPFLLLLLDGALGRLARRDAAQVGRQPKAFWVGGKGRVQIQQAISIRHYEEEEERNKSSLTFRRPVVVSVHALTPYLRI